MENAEKKMWTAPQINDLDVILTAADPFGTITDGDSGSTYRN